MKGVDRISLLSDSLLHHILSFLDIRSVVKTCVLSKRWKTLWTDIPTLNFDFDSYRSTGNAPISRGMWIKRFIFRVLSDHRSKAVKRVSYSSSIHTDEAALVVGLLICYARHHQVEELCLNTYNNVYFEWPLGLIGCYSLTVLKMTCAFVDDWEDLYLPRLKILEIEYEWEDWVYEAQYKETRMLSGCSNLESLVVVNCICESASIDAPKLEKFELSVSSKWILTFPQVELLTPNLKSVKFNHVLPTIKSTSELSCIDKVTIALDDSDLDGDGSATQNLTAEISQLLQAFHNARSFTLPLKTIEGLLSVPPSLSGFSFHNLRHLKLKAESTNKMISLPISTLMNSLKCPNLEMLEIETSAALAEINEELAQTRAALAKINEELAQTQATVVENEQKLAAFEERGNEMRAELANFQHVFESFVNNQRSLRSGPSFG